MDANRIATISEDLASEEHEDRGKETPDPSNSSFTSIPMVKIHLLDEAGTEDLCPTEVEMAAKDILLQTFW